MGKRASVPSNLGVLWLDIYIYISILLSISNSTDYCMLQYL